MFIVGGAGGVPHYTDYYKHVRLGDVVMSTPNDKGHIYVFCNKVCAGRKYTTMFEMNCYAILLFTNLILNNVVVFGSCLLIEPCVQ